MAILFRGRRLQGAYVSTWLVTGLSLILVAVVLAMAWAGYNREKNGMARLLSEKGTAIIKAFEAGARTGMMGAFGSEAKLQTLIDETAALPDILYVALVEPSGKVLAHSDSRFIGRKVPLPSAMSTLAPGEKTKWRIVEDKSGKAEAFEVYKYFMPMVGRMSGHRHPRRDDPRWNAQRRDGQRMDNRRMGPPRPDQGWFKDLPMDRLTDPAKRPVIFLGMDPRPFEQAMAVDVRNSAILAVVLALLGITGMISMFWAHSHARSRKLLRDTRALAAEVVANLPAGLVVVSQDGNITYGNAMAADILGVAPDKLAGTPAASAMPSQVLGLAASISPNKHVAEVELDRFPGSSRPWPMVVSVAAIVSDDGSPLGHMFIFKDLREVRRLQEEVRRKEKMAAVGHLAAGVAHEVRNPLSSIKGYATYFAGLFADDEEKRQAAEIMARETDRLNRVISELLEFARPSDLKPRPVDPARVLDNAIRLISHEAEGSRIALHTDIPAGLPRIQADPDRLIQAVLNLLVNAMQAMNDGGELFITACDKGQSMEITISDTGPGIAEGMRETIFDPYYTTKGKGTGLGLGIVRKIVEAHGGGVSVAGAAEGGAAFTLSLPTGRDKDDS